MSKSLKVRAVSRKKIAVMMMLAMVFLGFSPAYSRNNDDVGLVNDRVHDTLTKSSLGGAAKGDLSSLMSDVYYNNFMPSAREVYNNAVSLINSGEVEQAKRELKRILYEIDQGRCVDISDKHTIRAVQYKSHVILANVAFAEKNMDALDQEIAFFLDADTTKSEWKRALCAATHYKHKYFQLQNGKYGKVLGDWVSPFYNSDGVPMVWIRVYLSGNTLCAELKDCGVKTMLDSKYASPTDKIALDNTQNIVEMNFGKSELMPGMQFLPGALVSMVNSMGNSLSEAVAWKSTKQNGTPYTGNALWKQTAIDGAVLLASALFARLSVTKETVASESFVMRKLSSEVYMTDIKLRSITAYSDGRSEEEFNWAEIPVFHLYPSEEMDFSKGNFGKNIITACQYVYYELGWDDTEENLKEAGSVAKDALSSLYAICNVEDTRFAHPFYFLGKDINFLSNSEPYATSFTGLAQARHLWGFKGEPINPLTGTSEINKYIIPLRGEFKTILSPYECVTFTGDLNNQDNGGNGLLTYVNTYSPEFSFTYEGTIKKGYPHGLGIWQGDDFRYVGWFYKGKKFGYGTMTYADGREEHGFVTEDGSMIPESMVTWEMKQDFNEKVNNIASDKYETITDEFYWLNKTAK